MEDPHPNSPSHRRISWRHYVTLPSVLAPAVKARIKELKRPSFSQHAIETVCFDLRIRRPHAVTGQFARELPEIQGRKRNGMKGRCTGSSLTRYRR
jgi:hypothetical protein